MNFKQLQIEIDLDGTIETVDISKELGNIIYKGAVDLGQLELARNIYLSKGDIELTEEDKDTIKENIKGFRAFVQLAIIKALNE